MIKNPETESKVREELCLGSDYTHEEVAYELFMNCFDGCHSYPVDYVEVWDGEYDSHREFYAGDWNMSEQEVTDFLVKFGVDTVKLEWFETLPSDDEDEDFDYDMDEDDPDYELDFDEESDRWPIDDFSDHFGSREEEMAFWESSIK
jgi:hypothetical protein